MNENTNQINGVLRGGLAATGGAAFAAGHDDWVQLLGALVTVASIVWSILEKRRDAAARRTLPPGSAGLQVLCVLGAGLLLSGCQTPPTAGELSALKLAASEAAYVGASYDLAEHPDHRAHYALCQQALAALVAADSYTPEKLAAALANLPALVGANGALLDGGLTLYTVTFGFVPIDNAPRVKAIVLGLQDGLARALARPTGTATRALAPELPPQITVPAR